MPLPPPPAMAFTITGRPSSDAMNARACSSLVGPNVAGRTGTPRRSASERAAVLSPSSSSVSATRADEDETVIGAGAREPCVLAQEPVAGVDGAASRTACRVDDRIDREIRRRSCAGQFDGVVGDPNME